MFRVISISIVSLIFSACLVFGQKSYVSIEKETLDEILAPNRYDPKVIPYSQSNDSAVGKAVVVKVNIYFRDIEYVCSKRKEWKVQTTFRQQWNDPRLKFDDKNAKIKYLTLDDVKKIWKPDVFFSNSKSEEPNGALEPNILVRIYPDGNVLFSTRLTLTLGCPMDLVHYPFDKQSCPLKIASYGHTVDDIIFGWKNDTPIEVNKDLQLSGMILDSYNTDDCSSEAKTGVYSCLKVNFEFERVTSKYVTNWFLPTAVITFISFVSFWLRRDSSARILTLVITLLLVYLHTVLINYKSPPVSYSTATDCWTSTCLLFIFAAIIEYGIVKWFDRCHKCNNKKTDSNKDCEKSKTNNCEEGDAVAMKPLVEDGHDNHVEEGAKEYTVNDVSNRRNYVQKWKRAPIGCRIDSIAGIIFPLLFILYIITFFSYEYMY